MIYLSDDKEAKNRVLRMLNILLSKERNSEEITDSLKSEFDIDLTKQMEREADKTCN